MSLKRCLATGNPIGTDTWEAGRPCRCANCSDALELERTKAELAFAEEVIDVAHDAVRAALKLCQVSVSDILQEHESRRKLRLAIFNTLELPTLNLGSIAHRVKRRRNSESPGPNLADANSKKRTPPMTSAERAKELRSFMSGELRFKGQFRTLEGTLDTVELLITKAITSAQNDKLEEAASHFERYSAAFSGRSFAATLRALKSKD